MQNRRVKWYAGNRKSVQRCNTAHNLQQTSAWASVNIKKYHKKAFLFAHSHTIRWLHKVLRLTSPSLHIHGRATYTYLKLISDRSVRMVVVIIIFNWTAFIQFCGISVLCSCNRGVSALTLCRSWVIMRGAWYRGGRKCAHRNQK